MRTVNVNLGKNSYSIFIGKGNIDNLGETMKRFNFGRRALIITNDVVNPIYGDVVKQVIENAGFTVFSVVVPDGEEFKSLTTVNKIYNYAVDHRLDRYTPVVALGGGVVGDLAGLFAATYLRGLPFIQVPTTLLAQVDSSVGGKVAVNHPKGKNLIGSFYQPKFVLSDINTLSSLPERELIAGMAEVVKYGVIFSPELFSYLEDNVEDCLALSGPKLSHVIDLCCALKARVVERDEREDGDRIFLNFGHTTAHAIELVTGYTRYRHGEAVGIGMTTISKVAAKMGLMPWRDAERVVQLIAASGLPGRVDADVDLDEVMAAFTRDKKVRNGKLNLVVPTSIGHMITSEAVPVELIRETLAEGR
ncbi:MAG: 3-dehydroquinate synthase [Bacillota bacterium]